MDFGWILDGFWMDFGWILDGFWMDFSWIFDRVLMDSGWILDQTKTGSTSLYSRPQETTGNVFLMTGFAGLCISWFLHEMVTQNRFRTHEGNQVLSGRRNKICSRSNQMPSTDQILKIASYVGTYF